MAKLIKENIPFTMIANDVLKDKNISFRAKGLYAYLFSKPEEWDFSSHRMVLETKEGRKAIMSALRELEGCELLKRNKLPDGRVEYILKHSQKSLSPKMELRDLGNEIPRVPGFLGGTLAPISNTELDTNTYNTGEPPEVGSKAPAELFPSEEDLESVPCDEEGNPIVVKQKKSAKAYPISQSAVASRAADIRMRKLHPPFSFEAEFNKLHSSTWKVDKIVALLWGRKNYHFENWDQFNAQLGKDRKLVKPLTGYSGKEISRTIDLCEKDALKNGYEWQATTIAKKIADVINK